MSSGLLFFFWLCSAFVAALGLSLFVIWRLLSFSLRRLLLFQSTDSRAHRLQGFVASQHVESLLTRGWTCVPLPFLITREVPQSLLTISWAHTDNTDICVPPRGQWTRLSQLDVIVNSSLHFHFHTYNPFRAHSCCSIVPWLSKKQNSDYKN